MSSMFVPFLLFLSLLQMPFSPGHAKKAHIAAKASAKLSLPAGNGTLGAVSKVKDMHLLSDALGMFVDAVDTDDDGSMSRKEVDMVIAELKQKVHSRHSASAGVSSSGSALAKAEVRWTVIEPLVITLVGGIARIVVDIEENELKRNLSKIEKPKVEARAYMKGMTRAEVGCRWDGCATMPGAKKECPKQCSLEECAGKACIETSWPKDGVCRNVCANLTMPMTRVEIGCQKACAEVSASVLSAKAGGCVKSCYKNECAGKACIEISWPEDSEECQAVCAQFPQEASAKFLSYSSLKINKKNALNSVKRGFDSLMKIADVNKDGNVTHHEIQKLVSLLKKGTTGYTKSQTEMLKTLEGAFGHIKRGLEALGLSNPNVTK